VHERETVIKLWVVGGTGYMTLSKSMDMLEGRQAGKQAGTFFWRKTSRNIFWKDWVLAYRACAGQTKSQRGQ